MAEHGISVVALPPKGDNTFDILLEREKSKKGASIASSVLNLANTIMGTGILALPFALAGSGVLLGIVFLFLSATFGGVSLHLLAQSAHTSGRPATFRSVCDTAYPRLSIIVDLIVVMNGFLACLSFLIVASDSFSKLLPSGGPPRQVWTLIALCCVTPLCLLRRLDALKFTSALSMVMLAFISLLVVLFSFNLETPLLDPCPSPALANATNGSSSSSSSSSSAVAACKGVVEVIGHPIDTLRSFATFVIAFTCQQNVFAVTNELRDPTPRRCLTVIVLSLGLALLLYLVVGFAGYLTFGSNVASDILTSYPEGNGLVSAARIGIATVVITCFPLQAFAVRTSLGTLLSAGFELCNQDNTAARISRNSSHNGADGSGRSLSGLNAVFTLEPFALCVMGVFLGTTTSLALGITKLGSVIDVNGSVAGTSITFIAPGLVYFLIHKAERKTCMGYIALVMIAFGVVLVPVSLAVAFIPPTSSNTSLTPSS